MNLLAIALGIAWLCVLRIWFVPSNWITAGLALLVGLSLGLLRADALLARGRQLAAIATFAASNWAVEISITALIPFALVILPIAILLPTLLAAPHLTRPQLGVMLGATLVVELATGVVGRTFDGVGLEAQAPAWALHAMVVLFIPVVTGLAVYLAWQIHIGLSAKAAELGRSRLRLVTSADGERRRIERALNAGIEHRITRAAAGVATAQQLAATDRETACDVLADVVAGLQEASGELRELAHGVYPPQLAKHGLAAALRAAAVDARVSTTVRVADVGRYRSDIEAVVYFCCIEAMDDAVRRAADVTVTLRGGSGLSFDVEDTGRGGAPVALGTGDSVTAMTDRIGAIGGALTVESVPGGAVRVRGDVPRYVLGDPGAAPVRHRVVDVPCAALTLVWNTVRRIVAPTGAESAAQQVSAGLQAQLVPTLGTIVLLLGIYAIIPNGWLLALALLTAAAAGAFFTAKRATEGGRLQEALAIATVSIWIYALLVTVLVPLTLPHAAILVVVPTILAVPHLRRDFRLVAGGTVVFAVAVAVVGRFAPGVGIEAAAPRWLADVELIAITLVNSTVLLFIVSLNHSALTARAEELQGARGRVVAAADRARRRIERDLHDGAQQRLVAAAIQAQVARTLLTTRPEQALPLLDQLATELRDAGVELHDLAQGIFPVELARHGLVEALRSAAARAPLPVVLHVTGIVRYRPEVELNVYFSCLEGLQNALKHAGDSATVTIRLIDDDRDGMSFEVLDSGSGCAPEAVIAGHGYGNISDRMAAIGGTLQVDARPGSGVRLRGCVPSPGRASDDGPR